ncbi:unnamed protein product [Prunus armeniaca]
MVRPNRTHDGGIESSTPTWRYKLSLRPWWDKVEMVKPSRAVKEPIWVRSKKIVSLDPWRRVYCRPDSKGHSRFNRSYPTRIALCQPCTGNSMPIGTVSSPPTLHK